MKKLITIFASIILMTLSANVMAQNTATVANASSTARIITKITLANVTPLNFGTIAQTTAGGTVTLLPTNDVAVHTNATGEVTSSTESRAVFNLTGESNALFSIALPNSDVTLTRVDGTETMLVNGFAANSSITSSLIEADGTNTFNVGATLNVGVNQVAGTYNGTYSVTVAYN